MLICFIWLLADRCHAVFGYSYQMSLSVVCDTRVLWQNGWTKIDAIFTTSYADHSTFWLWSFIAELQVEPLQQLG